MSLIALVGLPGAGKSTAAAALASALGWKNIDLDDKIEQKAGKTIPQIFEEDGQFAFRDLEIQVSREVAESDRAVVATGGGWMANSRARALLRPVARIIYLRVTPTIALARLGGATAGRPLLSGTDPLGRLERLLRDRRQAYESADAVMDVEALSPQQVTQELLALVRTLDIIR
jgi:shikimate kinase